MESRWRPGNLAEPGEVKADRLQREKARRKLFVTVGPHRGSGIGGSRYL